MNWRVIFHHHGRTESGKWISHACVWDVLLHWSSLLDGEWIGIQERGKRVRVYKRGAWINHARVISGQ